MQAGSQLSPGAASGLAGTLTLGSAGLSLANMTLSMQLSSSPAGANDRVVMTGGPLTMTGALNFAFSLPDGVLGAGEYFLVSGAATGSASSVTFTHNLINTPRQTFTIPPAGTDPFIKLIVAGNPATLVWKGNVSATWDTAATANWLNGAAGDVFQTGDAVVFDDTSTVNSVSIAATAAPRSLAFTNAVRAITLGGTDPSVAAVTGGALTKTGAGALTLTGTNDFASVTIGPGATMTLANDYANRGALGGGPVTFNGGTLTMHDDVNFSTTGSDDSTWALVIPAGQSGRLHADSRCNLYGTLSGGGTFNFRAPFARTTLLGDWSAFSGTINVLTDADGGDFRIGTSYAPAGYASATINLSAGVWLYYIGTSASGTGTTIAIGELSGPSGTHLRGGVTGGRNFIYRIGEKTPAGGEVVFAGDIAEQNTGTTTSYVKTGAGVWRLSGSGAWNGGTVVEQGTLRLWPSNAAGFTCAGATDVLAGAALGLGTGRFETDALNIAAGAVLTVEDDFNLAGDFNNDGTATILTGHFTVSGDMVNNGTLRMQGLSTLAASGEFTNNGLLDLLTSSASLPVNFTNNGTVILNTDRRIRSAAKSGAIFTVSVQGYAGHTFQLQRAGALAGPWVNTGAAQAGSASILSLTDAGGAAGGRGFYRVVVTP